jgi:precorrin isomerase
VNLQQLIELIDRLETGAEIYIGTPVGGLFLDAANALHQLRQHLRREEQCTI